MACQSNIISIDGGKVSGIPSQKEGVTVFKGIPFAAPTCGENRSGGRILSRCSRGRA